MPDNDAPQNPVTLARSQVEAVIPPERRGPGWDRHWRELEAYAQAALDSSSAGDWTLVGGE